MRRSNKKRNRVKEPTPQQAQLIVELEKLAAQIGVEVRISRCNGKGGMCRWRDRWLLVIDRSFDPVARIELMAEELARFDCEGVYMVPAVRALLERYREGNVHILLKPPTSKPDDMESALSA